MTDTMPVRKTPRRELRAAGQELFKKYYTCSKKFCSRQRAFVHSEQRSGSGANPEFAGSPLRTAFLPGQVEAMCRVIFWCGLLWFSVSELFAEGWTLTMEEPVPEIRQQLRADVPGPFIFDPLTQQSRPNRQGLELTGEFRWNPPGLAWQPQGSFTLEAFIKPTAATAGLYVVKEAAGPSGAEAGLMLDHFHAHNQFYLRGAVRESPSQPSVRPWVGYYGSVAQYQGEQDQRWRHLALVYDAAARQVTVYIDYYLSRTELLTRALAFDAAPLRLGSPGVCGLIDEVRYVPRALRPGEFQRVVNEPLSDVSFVSQQQIVPMDAGCLDIREHFGAVGDGVHDDTAAFQRAFDELCSRVPLAYHTLIIPAGTYLITETIQGGRFIDIKGAGPDQTVLRLRDGTFTDPAQPRPILRLSSSRQPPGTYPQTNGSSISIYLEGMTFDTGTGNPGAKGVEYHSNNLGRFERVQIRSGDGLGVSGLDLTHHDCGPALVKHVEVLGFDYGIHSAYQEYSMTFEHVRLIGQRVAGIRNQGNILAIRGLYSLNKVPAILNEGANSMITLLDSDLHGSDATEPAIRSDGALYCLRVNASGYPTAVAGRVLVEQNPNRWEEIEVRGPYLEEYVTREPVRGFGTASQSLKLPIQETPEASHVPLDEWVNVLKFVRSEHEGDGSRAWQAAIDSGARVLYLPANSRLEYRSPIRLSGKVERIVGFGQGLSWSAAAWPRPQQREQSDPTTFPPPLLIFDDPDEQRTVWLDRCEVQSLLHASAGTLVLRSSSVDHYRTGRGGGRLFAEDIGGADWHFDHPQQVWVRQWNPESHSAGPCVHQRGGRMWVLGFKTEYESQKLLTEAGAETEILGAFIYPIGEIPADRPIFENRNSRLTLVYGTSVYGSNHQLHIRDQQGTTVRRVGNEALRWAGSRAKMELYLSDATGP